MADLPIKPAETPVTPVETPDIVVPPSVESARAPVEVPRESAPVVEAVVSEPEPEPREPVAPPPAPVPVRPSAPPKDPLTARIEDVLAEDMTDVFLKMSPDKQAAFKEKGEETASKIRQMVDGAKVNAKKMFDLIREWLKLIPGVNKFFLEQEAKIKTDKILNLKP